MLPYIAYMDPMGYATSAPDRDMHGTHWYTRYTYPAIVCICPHPAKTGQNGRIVLSMIPPFPSPDSTGEGESRCWSWLHLTPPASLKPNSQDCATRVAWKQIQSQIPCHKNNNVDNMTAYHSNYSYLWQTRVGNRSQGLLVKTC